MGGRKRETPMCDCLLCAPHWGPGHHPCMCPNQELNQRPLALQSSAQSTEPHQPGLNYSLKILKLILLLGLFSVGRRGWEQRII